MQQPHPPTPEDTKDGAALNSAKQRLRRRKMQQSKRAHSNEDPNLRNSFFEASPASTPVGPAGPNISPNGHEPNAGDGGTVAVHRPIARRPGPLRSRSSNSAGIFTTGRTSDNHYPVAQQLQSQQLQQASNLTIIPTQKTRRRSARSASSLARKYKKPSWYHNVAAQNRLGSINEDAFLLNEPQKEDEEGPQEIEVPPQQRSQQPQPPPTQTPSATASAAKRVLLQELNRTGGESNTPAFQSALQTLLKHYDPTHFNPRKPIPRYATACAANQFEGVGIAAGKPAFPGCIGRNNHTGDPMYKLGTMSFDMFCPTQLVVSVQGTFVLIDTVDGRNPRGVRNVPNNLLADVRFGKSPVRTYDIVTPFTIEPWRPEFGDKSPNKGVDQPIRGVMTTYGFLLPYPTQNRFSVWFTGGSLEVDGHKNEKWFQIFDKDSAPKRTAAESGKVLAVKLLMGASTNNGEMDKDGRLSYSLSRPKASHIDLIYLDKTLQVLRGSSGTVYVHVRLPGSKAVHESTCTDELLSVPMDPCLQVDNSNIKDESDDSHHNNDRGVHEFRSGSQNTVNTKPSFRLPGLDRLRFRKTLSEANLQSTSFQGDDAACDARLQELDSYIVTPPNVSCLRKTRSYGIFEQRGTNIPISHDRKALVALPKHESQMPEICKEQQKRKWKRLRRTISDPLVLALELDPSSLKNDGVTETSSTDSEEDHQQESLLKVPATTRRKLQKAVSFSCLEIRNCSLTVGDPPPCISGVVRTEIRSASAEVERVKHQREFTNRYRSNPSSMKVEGAIASVQRKAKRMVNRLKQKDDCKSGVAGVA